MYQLMKTYRSILTMISSGEANMEIRDTTVKYPTKTCRFGGSKILMLTTAMIANKAKTATKDTSILHCKKTIS